MEITLDENKFDKRSMELLENFINEFDELFGEFLSREELIKKIQSNLNAVQFEEMEEEYKHASGYYNHDDKIIKIVPNLKDEDLKSLFFHEMIHCITAIPEQKRVGFRVETQDSEGEHYYGRGLNEGFAEYLTMTRNKRFRENGNKVKPFCPIMTKIASLIESTIGKEKFLNIAFREPSKLEQELGESISNPISFLERLDVIYAKEKDIRSRDRKKLMSAIREEEMEEDSILEITQSELLRDWQGLVMSKTTLGDKTDFSIMANRINSFMKALRCENPNGLDIGKLMEYGAATDIPNEELEPIFSIFFNVDISQDDLIRVQEEMKKDKKLTNLTDTYVQAEIGQDEILDSMRLLQQTKEQTSIPEKEETRD